MFLLFDDLPGTLQFLQMHQHVKLAPVALNEQCTLHPLYNDVRTFLWVLELQGEILETRVLD